MIMGDTEKAEDLMKRLKDLGLQLAIDDFGTGVLVPQLSPSVPNRYAKD